MEPSDADVIAASLAEPAAFGAIFDRHASTILRYFGRRGITLELLGNLMRSRGTIDRRPPKWLSRVIERLDMEFAENISSEDLAADAGVHPVHLASVFRKFQNETIGDHVQKKRVEHARELLHKADLPLCEIAYVCGFADQSHFTRIFKRRVGMTPGAYRNSLS